jgi:hypothetical protein
MMEFYSMKTRTLLALGALLFSSHAKAAPKPTATEVFHLRSEGQKIAESLEYLRGAGGHWSINWSSNYNTEDGHCYMMVWSFTSSEGRTAGMECSNMALYDAQTEDMKAFAERGTACPDKGPPPHKYQASTHGMIFAGEKSCDWSVEDHGFGCATDYMNHKMQSD